MTMAFDATPGSLVGFEILHRGFIIAASLLKFDPDAAMVVASLRHKFEGASELCHCGKMITPTEPGRRLIAPAVITLDRDEAQMLMSMVKLSAAVR